MRGRRIAWVLAAATAPVLALAACSSSGGSGGDGPAGGSSGGTYDIGYSNGLTGLTAAFAVPGSKMVRAIFNVVNASGGVHGHKIKVTILDQGNPGSGQAAANVTQLATSDKVSAILGMSISNDCASVVSLAAKYTTPLLCERTATNELSPVQKYVFNDVSSEIAEVAPQIALLKKLVSTPHPRVAIIGNNNIGTNTWAAAMQKAVKAMGGKVVAYQNMSETATSVTANEEAIVASHPDVLLGEIFQQFWPPLLTGMKSAGLKVPVITTDGDIFYSQLTSLKMPNVYETSLTSPLDPGTTNPQERKLVAALSKLVGGTADDLNAGEGTSIAAGPYVIVAALQECGYPCPGPKMATALESATTNVGGLAPGGFGYSPSLHFGPKEFMFYHWDSSANALASAATEPAGNPVTGVPGS
jgi:ABC-type branched-subunit amino acid transport system substrate-binding protein